MATTTSRPPLLPPDLLERCARRAPEYDRDYEFVIR